MSSNKKISRKAKILPQFSIYSGNKPPLDLLEIQRKSFCDLLERGIIDELSKTDIFRETAKFSGFTQELELVFNPDTYKLVSPNCTPKEAILKGKTYACKLYVQATLTIRFSPRGSVFTVREERELEKQPLVVPRFSLASSQPLPNEKNSVHLVETTRKPKVSLETTLPLKYSEKSLRYLQSLQPAQPTVSSSPVGCAQGSRSMERLPIASNKNSPVGCASRSGPILGTHDMRAPLVTIEDGRRKCKRSVHSQMQIMVNNMAKRRRQSKNGTYIFSVLKKKSLPLRPHALPPSEEKRITSSMLQVSASSLAPKVHVWADAMHGASEMQPTLRYIFDVTRALQRRCITFENKKQNIKRSTTTFIGSPIRKKVVALLSNKKIDRAFEHLHLISPLQKYTIAQRRGCQLHAQSELPIQTTINAHVTLASKVHMLQRKRCTCSISDVTSVADTPCIAFRSHPCSTQRTHASGEKPDYISFAQCTPSKIEEGAKVHVVKRRSSKSKMQSPLGVQSEDSNSNSQIASNSLLACNTCYISDVMHPGAKKRRSEEEVKRCGVELELEKVQEKAALGARKEPAFSFVDSYASFARPPLVDRPAVWDDVAYKGSFADTKFFEKKANKKWNRVNKYPILATPLSFFKSSTSFDFLPSGPILATHDESFQVANDIGMADSKSQEQFVCAESRHMWWSNSLCELNMHLGWFYTCSVRADLMHNLRFAHAPSSIFDGVQVSASRVHPKEVKLIEQNQASVPHAPHPITKSPIYSTPDTPTLRYMEEETRVPNKEIQGTEKRCKIEMDKKSWRETALICAFKFVSANNANIICQKQSSSIFDGVQVHAQRTMHQRSPSKMEEEDRRSEASKKVYTFAPEVHREKSDTEFSSLISRLPKATLDLRSPPVHKQISGIMPIGDDNQTEGSEVTYGVSSIDNTGTPGIASALKRTVNSDEIVTQRVKIFRPWIFLGELPLMTKRGHFILNGSPRVIVNQMARCPGIYFQEKRRGVGFEQEVRVSADLIPQRGPWLRIQSDWEGRFWARLKREGRVKYATLYEAFQEFEKQYSAPLISLVTNSSSSFPKSEILAFQERKVKEDRQKKALVRFFKNSTRYSLGKQGRLRINQRVHSSQPKSSSCQRQIQHRLPFESTPTLRSNISPLGVQKVCNTCYISDVMHPGAKKRRSEGDATYASLTSAVNNSGANKLVTPTPYVAHSHALALIPLHQRCIVHVQPIKDIHLLQNKEKNPEVVCSLYRGKPLRYAMHDRFTDSTSARKDSEELHKFWSSFLSIRSPFQRLTNLLCIENVRQFISPKKQKEKAIFALNSNSNLLGKLTATLSSTELDTIASSIQKQLKSKSRSVGGAGEVAAYGSLSYAPIDANQSTDNFSPFQSMEYRNDVGASPSTFGSGVQYVNKNAIDKLIAPVKRASRSGPILECIASAPHDSRSVPSQVQVKCTNVKANNSNSNSQIASNSLLACNTRNIKDVTSEEEVKRCGVELKLDIKNPVDNTEHLLMATDVNAIHLCLEHLLEGQGFTDDIDHLKNRLVRTSGKLLQQQLELGLDRLSEVMTPLLGNLIQGQLLYSLLPSQDTDKSSLHQGRASHQPLKKNLRREKKTFGPNDLHHSLKPIGSLSTEGGKMGREQVKKVGNQLDGSTELEKNQKEGHAYKGLKTGAKKMQKEVLPVKSLEKQNASSPQENSARRSSSLQQTPFRWLRTSKPVNNAFREFFGSNPLSQYMDQTNPLAEITHKRRLSSMGPGGIKRETAGMEVRGIHPTHYGRVCPIETPEGKNAGLVNSPTVYGRIGKDGFMETPLYQVVESQVQKERWAFFSAQQEEFEESSLATGDTGVTRFNFLSHVPIPVQTANNPLAHFQQVERNRVGYKALSPVQTISIATALIPFLEHDDANRALMGSNMQRQAIPLISPERPIVGTGFEPLVMSESGQAIQATKIGCVSHVSANKIILESIHSTWQAPPTVRSCEVTPPYYSRIQKGDSISNIYCKFFYTREKHNNVWWNRTVFTRCLEPPFLFKVSDASSSSILFAPSVHRDLRCTQSTQNNNFSPIIGDFNYPCFARPFVSDRISDSKERVQSKEKVHNQTESLVSFSKGVIKPEMQIRLSCISTFAKVSALLAPSSIFDGDMHQRCKCIVHSALCIVHCGDAWSGEIGSENKKIGDLMKLVDDNHIYNQLILDNEQTNSFLKMALVLYHRRRTAGLSGALEMQLSLRSAWKMHNQRCKQRFRLLESCIVDLPPGISPEKKADQTTFIRTVIRSRLGSNIRRSAQIYFGAPAVQRSLLNFWSVLKIFCETRKNSRGFKVGNYLVSESDYVECLVPKVPVKCKTLWHVKNFNSNSNSLRELLPILASNSQIASNSCKASIASNSRSELELELTSSLNSFLNSFTVHCGDAWNAKSHQPKQKERSEVAFSGSADAILHLSSVPCISLFSHDAPQVTIKDGRRRWKKVHLFDGKGQMGNLNVKKNKPLRYAMGLLTDAQQRTTEVDDQMFGFSHSASVQSEVHQRCKEPGNLHISKKFSHQTATNLNLCSTQSAFLFKKVEQSLQLYQRSNQETCLSQRPLVHEGDWVQKGDFLADCSASHSGDLALGKNVTVAYMPWEGYNFEDAIVISDRLVANDIYTSIHIERYEIKVSKNSQGKERITNQIPSLSSQHLKHLDSSGIARVSSWVQPGDILVGKVVELKRPLSPYERLAWELASRLSPNSPEREKWLSKVWLEDISLRLPAGVCGRVINFQIISTEWSEKEHSLIPLEVHVYLAVKRKIQVGDKLAGRHGNKGIVSIVLPRQDMPYLGDGSSVDMVLNPLGVPSRMNLGQIFECLLGLAGSQLGCNFKVTPFDEIAGGEASRSLVFLKLYQCRLIYKQQWLFTPTFPGKNKLFDGRTGEPFENWVTVGQAYMLKLIHMVDHKIHARSTGPYSLFTRQPVRGRSRRGGQRLGEMEVWAVEGFGAAYTLQEFLTIKSDDLKARAALQRSFYKKNDVTLGKVHISPGNPEAFRVLVSELQALCLHIQM